MLILKSSGVEQEFMPGKILKVIEYAAQGHNIDPYELLSATTTQIKDGMTSKEVQSVLIRVSSNHITKEQPDYQFVTANLKMLEIRKEVYGQHEPIPFIEHISKMVNENRYDREILQKWSAEEISILESHVKHERDFIFSYAGIQNLSEKYLIKDKQKSVLLETPQYAYMLIGMCLHQDEKENRLKYAIDFYNAASLQKISLPTPIMAGVRSPIRQFSSCVVIESGDSLNSINAASNSIVQYISKRAGIGINAGMLRAQGSKIGSGEVVHTGVIPFWKHFQTAVKSCSQGGVRGGAATLYYPMWHLEYENLIVLKNNKGTNESRIRHLDYGVQINDLMIERFIKNEYITLFSPNAHPELYDSYFSDPEKFRKIYTELEKDQTVAKKRIKAKDAFIAFIIERANTGRIYPQFVDNVNQYGPFIRALAPIKMSNLCAEIALPTRDVNSEDPLINLCTLSAFVLDKFDYRDQEEIDQLSRIMVRALDNLLDYQDYPVKEALNSKRMRSLGIGVVNYAGWLASNFANYQNSNVITHELFERLQFGLIKASVGLAKEKGSFEDISVSKYGKGELPIDWYNKHVDELVEPNYVCDWEDLRKDLKKYGIRNATLTALMPAETSASISNSTNGIEPPRSAISTKLSKSGAFKQIVPNYEELGSEYEYAWEMTKKGNKGYIQKVAIMQKFVDQSISANTYYDPENFQTGKVSMKVLMDELLYCWYYSVKNLYYHNTRDGSDDDMGDEKPLTDLPSEADVDMDCVSCKL